MDWQIWIGIGGLLSGLVIGLPSVWFGWHQHRAFKEEQKKRKEAEAQLQENDRRKEFWLVPSSKSFNNLYYQIKSGEIRFFPAGFKNLLCFFRSEVDAQLAPGEQIFFVVNNLYNNFVTMCSVELDDETIRIAQEPDINGANGLRFLIYPFDPVKYGKEQRLKVFIQTSSGAKDCHIYRTKHGIRFLERIDPA